MLKIYNCSRFIFNFYLNVTLAFRPSYGLQLVNISRDTVKDLAAEIQNFTRFAYLVNIIKLFDIIGLKIVFITDIKLPHGKPYMHRCKII